MQKKKHGKIDIGLKYIVFEDEKNTYAVTFRESCFGNIHEIGFSVGEKGEKVLSTKEVKAVAARPNIWGQMIFLAALLFYRLKNRKIG